MGPDPKPARRIKDPALLRLMHLRGGFCVLCGNPASIHHVHAKPRDDVPGNLVWLCGDGTTGHHGLIENEDVATRLELGAYIRDERPDIVLYVQEKLGYEEGEEWLRQRFYMRL
jgi:hypothetical protein